MPAYDKETLEVGCRGVHRVVDKLKEEKYLEKESPQISTSETEGDPEVNHDQDAFPLQPQTEPEHRSYVSRESDPPAVGSPALVFQDIVITSADRFTNIQWVEEPEGEASPLPPSFRVGETVLLLRAGRCPEGPYTIKASHGDGRYSLYYVKRVVSKSELKHPDHQSK